MMARPMMRGLDVGGAPVGVARSLSAMRRITWVSKQDAASSRSAVATPMRQTPVVDTVCWSRAASVDVLQAAVGKDASEETYPEASEEDSSLNRLAAG